MPKTIVISMSNTFLNNILNSIFLTFGGLGQERGHQLFLQGTISVEEWMDAVQHRALQAQWLPFVNEGHEEHHNRRPVGGFTLQ